MNSKTALEKKYEIIKQNLGNQTTFYTDEVIPLFPELKKSTLYWNLSKLVEAGYIKRVRNGVFSFNDLKGRQGIILCETAQKLKNYMDELGFYYYISGLDILAKYMLHIPEQYPVIAFIEKAAIAFHSPQPRRAVRGKFPRAASAKGGPLCPLPSTTSTA